MSFVFVDTDSELITVAMVIKARRLELNISQEALAGMANMHRTHLSLFERKSCNLSMRMFFELALALETTPTKLLKQAALLEKPVLQKRKRKHRGKLSNPRAKTRSKTASSKK